LTNFLPWDPTTQEFGFLSIPQRRKIVSNVSHNAEDSVPLWDTTKKNDTTQNDIFKFLVPLIAIG
jgi:hypothetical protein